MATLKVKLLNNFGIRFGSYLEESSIHSIATALDPELPEQGVYTDFGLASSLFHSRVPEYMGCAD